ncbi:MAG: PilZ domain-containing protein [Planctomycetes bacterium]|nr:PilZ domain-containing protein [Planctomycetota bacterium]MCB9825387.1 PilZ domain-containing protein [Planctomycetota bacterium]MCB9900869.1 PilZ domain-containing protein [Planctomycetota bacterium]
MSSAPPLADPLRAFLSGKRRSPRVEMRLDAHVHAAALSVRAQVMDVSEGGALVAISSSDLAEEGLADGLALMSLHERLAAGFRLVLDGVGLERDALAVRVATRMGEDDLTYVGCRFTSPLTVAEQRRIGLLDEQRPLVTPEWTEPVLLEALPLLVRKGVCVDVFAFGGERLAGPTFVGRLVGMGGTALCVASYIARDRGVFETVGDAPLRIELRRNGVELWTTQARPAAVRPGAEPLDPVEIGLVAEQTPPLAIRELLVPRR